MEAVLLGTGTSTGVPVLGCGCPVCLSSDPRNHRTRTSLAIKLTSETAIIIDTSPEFRLQALAAGIRQVEDVLYTHLHADHCHGFDDLRAFSFVTKKPVTCHLLPEYQEEITRRFSYAFEDTGYVGAKPLVNLKEIPDAPFTIGCLTVEPVRLPHGNAVTCAFRIGEFAYATDFKGFSPKQIASWRGKIKTMVASGIHFGTHPTHSTIPETIALFRELKVERGILTHLAHDVDAARDIGRLAPGVEFGYDGLTIPL